MDTEQHAIAQNSTGRHTAAQHTTERRIADTLERMRAAGLRITRTRRMVVKALTSSDRHLSADAVHSLLAGIGERIDLATVHRNLATLVALNLTHAVDTPQAAVFGLTERPHAHAVCRSCGKTADAARFETPVRAPEGFRIDGIVLQGTCDRCTAVVPDRTSSPNGQP